MNNVGNASGAATMEKYRTLVSIISGTEDRLRSSELVCFCLNIIVLLFSIAYIGTLHHKINYVFSYMDYALVFLILLLGMSINVYWVAFAMRIQLKLKLRYFQARSLERKLDAPGENIFSDEDIFFDPAVRRLESPDGKETLLYPTEGLTRMDGFAGSVKPRHFSWTLPCFFMSVYWIIFILLATTV